MGVPLLTESRKNSRPISRPIHRLRTAALAAAVGLTAVRSARAIVIRDDTADSLYTALSAQPQYASEGFVQVVTSTSGNVIDYNFGTATLIAPDWIVTAAHVVSSTTNNVTTIFPTSGMYFGQATTMSFPGTDTIANAVTEPGWNGTVSQGDDLALLQLATPITNIAPAQLYPGSVNSLLTMTATVVGYGYTGNGLTGYSSTDPGDDTRRAMQNVIDTTGGTTTNGGPPLNETYPFSTYSPNILFSDFDSPNPTVAANENIMGSSTALPLEGATAPGDSGGGLFVTTNGTTFLAGVTSFGATFTGPTPLGVYGEVSAFTSTAAASSMTFITETLITRADWSAPGSGSWAGINNWSTGQPPEFHHSTANFAGGTSANSTVTLDGDWTVGVLTFNSTNSYTLAPGNGGALTLDNTTSSSQPTAITDSGGTHFISAPITLLAKLNISVANAGDTLTLSGPIGGLGPVRFTGPGTLVLSGSNSYSSSTTVSNGQLRLGSANAIPADSQLILGATSKVSLLPSIGAVQLSALTIASTSSLDVANNAIAINYGSAVSDPISTIAGYLATGHGTSPAAPWSGLGLTSTTAAANPSTFSLGYADGDIDVGTVAQPNQILVMYTLAGDANLDGSVGFADLVAVAQHFGATGQDWADGNFTYAASGSVGFADLVLVAQNFGQALGLSASISPAWALPLSASAQVQSIAVVPEPATLALVALPLCGLLRRRRKH